MKIKTSSVILTIHNKEFLIRHVTKGLLDNVSPAVKELLVVFDGCTDNSERFFEEVVNALKPTINIIRIHTDDIWETKANNIALKKSTCEQSIIVQDDMVVTEKNFDRRLSLPLERFSDCFAITGRAAHNIVISNGKILYPDLIGREAPAGRDILGIRDVVNRGPLLLDNARLEKLDYLDEAFSPLEMDDHDLSIRAYRRFGWLVGSFIIDYQSELNWGGTRASEKSFRVWQQSSMKNAQIIAGRHGEHLAEKKHNENRYVRPRQ